MSTPRSPGSLTMTGVKEAAERLPQAAQGCVPCRTRHCWDLHPQPRGQKRLLDGWFPLHGDYAASMLEL